MAKKIDSMTAEQLKATLENLIASAQTIDSYEDSIFEEERGMARYEAREMVDTLLALGKEAGV